MFVCGALLSDSFLIVSVCVAIFDVKAYAALCYVCVVRTESVRKAADDMHIQ